MLDGTRLLHGKSFREGNKFTVHAFRVDSREGLTAGKVYTVAEAVFTDTEQHVVFLDDNGVYTWEPISFISYES